MNKHPYPNKKDGPLTDDPAVKAAWSLTVMKVKCPVCRSDPGYYCERVPPAKSAGAKRWPPHDEREKELRKIMPDAGKMVIDVTGFNAAVAAKKQQIKQMASDPSLEKMVAGMFGGETASELMKLLKKKASE